VKRKKGESRSISGDRGEFERVLAGLSVKDGVVPSEFMGASEGSKGDCTQNKAVMVGPSTVFSLEDGPRRRCFERTA